MGDMAEKWRSFSWETVEIDGHNVTEILNAFSRNKRVADKPYAVIANTIKGKGISFMENNNQWHHNRITKVQYETAMLELAD